MFDMLGNKRENYHKSILMIDSLASRGLHLFLFRKKYKINMDHGYMLVNKPIIMFDP
jgi:hypothetical protein